MTKLNCILLIDDDEPTNFLNKLIINEAGICDNVYGIQMARDALNYLKNRSDCPCNGRFIIPDLILLDINMPGINGWEFMEKYNQLPDDITSKVKIVMLTSSENPEDFEKARKTQRLAGIVTKPLTDSSLFELINNYFK